MNLLVTGGAGFIGSNLVNHLLNSDGASHGLEIGRIVTLDKLTYAGNIENLAVVDADPRHLLVRGDICDSALVSSLLVDHDIDMVMHLAAESHVDRSIDGPEAFMVTNVLGTFHLLDCFLRHVRSSGRASAPGYGKPVSRGGNCLFLHVSTDEVFGSLAIKDPAFRETTPYAPNNPYSASKAGSDHLVRSYFHTYGLPVVTLNSANNYGPFQFPEKLIPLMIRKTLRGEPLPIYGNGEQVRDWIYVVDNCRAMAMAAASGQPGSSYLVGARCELKNVEMVRHIVAAVTELAPERSIKTADELIRFVMDRPGHDSRYAIDPARITNELGWGPRETFASGLHKTVQWYLDHEEWIESIESSRYHGERLGIVD